MKRKLSHSELLQLKRWNTPTLYNGWKKLLNPEACIKGAHHLA